MATYTAIFRPLKVGYVGSTTFNNIPGITDSDANTYLSDTTNATKAHYAYLNYDFSSIPSNATVTSVAVQLVWLTNVSTSDSKYGWYNITKWDTTPSSSSAGKVTRSAWGAGFNGPNIPRNTAKTTTSTTGQALYNQSNRDFYNDVNVLYRSTFLSDSISLGFTICKNSSSSNVYWYDVPVTITYTIPTSTITVNAGTGGTATGGGEYTNGTQITISATPNTGYHFVSWNDGNTSASRTITVNGNATYTASFAINQYTISTAVSPSGSGSVTGGGTYNYGSTVTLTAVPATGYAFVKWQDNNSSTNPRSFTAYANGSYTAIFERSVIEPAITDILFNPARVQASQYSIITVTMEQI